MLLTLVAVVPRGWVISDDVLVSHPEKYGEGGLDTRPSRLLKQSFAHPSFSRGVSGATMAPDVRPDRALSFEGESLEWTHDPFILQFVSASMKMTQGACLSDRGCFVTKRREYPVLM